MSCFGIAALLGLCTGALVTGRPLAQGESFDYWSQVVKQVPVEVHGSLPGHPEPALAALLTGQGKPALTALVDDTGDGRSAGHANRLVTDPRRVVFFVNPQTEPTPAQVCRNQAAPQERPRDGRDARVDAILCNGTEAVAAAEAALSATGQSDGDIKNLFATVEDGLVEALRPSGDQ